MKCNKSETPTICEQPPPGLCSDQNENSGVKRFFYNSTSGVCEEYFICEIAGFEMEENSFSTKTLCIMHCRLERPRPGDKTRCDSAEGLKKHSV
ncbi:hypothetical protein V5799_003338 [Amblyomma americanum]|uniref:BPTI/Kunitz inhibitor domain-containing protein n=1 Tax=Amblyomma americanum TaxID=6943 RepID=A0AAQ4D993_AMBAM